MLWPQPPSSVLLQAPPTWPVAAPGLVAARQIQQSETMTIWMVWHTENCLFATACQDLTTLAPGCSTSSHVPGIYILKSSEVSKSLSQIKSHTLKLDDICSTMCLHTQPASCSKFWSWAETDVWQYLVSGELSKENIAWYYGSLLFCCHNSFYPHFPPRSDPLGAWLWLQTAQSNDNSIWCCDCSLKALLRCWALQSESNCEPTPEIQKF